MQEGVSYFKGNHKSVAYENRMEINSDKGAKNFSKSLNVRLDASKGLEIKEPTNPDKATGTPEHNSHWLRNCKEVSTHL